MFDFAGITEADWRALAPKAGGVGRWVWNLSTNICRLDETSLSMLGLEDLGPEMSINRFFQHVHPDDVVAVQTSADVARAGGHPYHAEFRMTTQGGRTIWVKGSGRFAETPSGQEILVGTNVDISELRAAQQTHELVAGEMAHRIGNLLGLTGSLFRLAAKNAPDVPTLEKTFMNRLKALSQVTQLSLRSSDQTVYSDELAHTVLADLLEGDQVTLDVDQVVLNAAASQTITLALNELLTNAIKYGGLSDCDGCIEVSIKADHANDNLRLTWHENTPFTVEVPIKTDGYGMTVLQRMTATTFRGEPVFEWRSSGLHFHCDWKLSAMT